MGVVRLPHPRPIVGHPWVPEQVDDPRRPRLVLIRHGWIRATADAQRLAAEPGTNESDARWAA